MKKYLPSFILFYFLSLSLKGQTIIEEKVIYSNPGVNNILTNNFGVANIEGSDYNNSFSNKVEVIDLADKGFLVRDNLKVLLFDNSLTQIAEVDLKDFYVPNFGSISFYPMMEGIYILQESRASYGSWLGASSEPQDWFKVMFLHYSGKTEIANFESRGADWISAVYNPSEQKLYVTPSYKKTLFIHTFKSPSLKPDLQTIPRKELKFVRTDTISGYIDDTNYKKTYHGRLYGFHELETGVFEIREFKGDEFVSTKKINLTLPFLKNAQDVKKYGSIYESIRFFIDPVSNNGLLIIKNHKLNGVLNALALIRFNMASDEVKVTIYNRDEFESKFKLTDMDCVAHSLSNILGIGGDAWRYHLNHHTILNFHGNAGASYASTVHAKKGLQITLDEGGEIVKVNKLKYPIINYKHNRLIVIPKKQEVLFQSPDYKKNEMDYIYSLEGVVPEENLFGIIKRDGYSFVFNFKKQNSEIKVTKLQF